MEEQKLVLQDGTYKYDDCTRQVSVSEEQLKKAGYVKLADDEQVVKKVVLSKEEAGWFEEYKHLPFSSVYEVDDFLSEIVKHWTGKGRTYYVNLFSRAYFTGYTIKDKKYYIKLNFNRGSVYLNVNEITSNWFFDTRINNSRYKTQFTQEKIDAMQKDPQAKGLDLNVLKVEVPEDELED